MKLSKRLQKLYDQLLPGHALWDIGCDHGKIGEYALQQQSFPRVHFVDRVPVIIESLKQKVNDPEAFFHLQDAGLTKLAWSGNIVIAGMGGMSMIRILQQQDLVTEFCRFILSPHRDQERLESFMRPFKKISAEQIQQRERTWPVLVYETVT